MSYTQTLYQIVFITKDRKATLDAVNRPALYAYMAGIIKEKGCIPFQIGGIEDHVHVITNLHPSVALATLVKDIKVASNKYIKETNLFPNFTSWASKYAAFTYKLEAKDTLIRYVKNQVAHHSKTTFYDEYIAFLKEFEIEYDERYLF
jgi:REP element-mobilizing transposase RayT